MKKAGITGPGKPENKPGIGPGKPERKPGIGPEGGLGSLESGPKVTKSDKTAKTALLRKATTFATFRRNLGPGPPLGAQEAQESSKSGPKSGKSDDILDKSDER